MTGSVMHALARTDEMFSYERDDRTLEVWQEGTALGLEAAQGQKGVRKPPP
jgi:hypothetical protein